VESKTKQERIFERKNKRAKLLYNILKRINVPVIIYLDTKYYRLEQCIGKIALTTKSWKDCRKRVGSFFYWDAFGIEGIVEEKIRLQTPRTRVVMPWTQGLDRRA
jgi:hypothetical protein